MVVTSGNKTMLPTDTTCRHTYSSITMYVHTALFPVGRFSLGLGDIASALILFACFRAIYLIAGISCSLGHN